MYRTSAANQSDFFNTHGRYQSLNRIMGDITDIVVLRLTRAEAEALDDLADDAMERLASNRNALAKFARGGVDLTTVANACDKLRHLVFEESKESTILQWANLIKQVPDKSRTSFTKHDGLSMKAAFDKYAKQPPGGGMALAIEDGVVVELAEPLQ